MQLKKFFYLSLSEEPLEQLKSLCVIFGATTIFRLVIDEGRRGGGSRCIQAVVGSKSCIPKE